MTKKLLFLFCIAGMCNFAFAQENPVQWNTKAQKINETEYILTIEASIEAG